MYVQEPNRETHKAGLDCVDHTLHVLEGSEWATRIRFPWLQNTELEFVLKRQGGLREAEGGEDSVRQRSLGFIEEKLAGP